MMQGYVVRSFIADNPLNRDCNLHSGQVAALRINKKAKESLPPTHGPMKLSDFRHGPLILQYQ